MRSVAERVAALVHLAATEGYAFRLFQDDFEFYVSSKMFSNVELKKLNVSGGSYKLVKESWKEERGKKKSRRVKETQG